MTIDQAAAQPVRRSVMWGMGIDLCHCLADCRPPYVFVFSSVGRLFACMCAHVVHFGLIGLSITACPGNEYTSFQHEKC